MVQILLAPVQVIINSSELEQTSHKHFDWGPAMAGPNHQPIKTGELARTQTQKIGRVNFNPE